MGYGSLRPRSGTVAVESKPEKAKRSTHSSRVLIHGSHRDGVAAMNSLRLPLSPSQRPVTNKRREVARPGAPTWPAALEYAVVTALILRFTGE